MKNVSLKQNDLIQKGKRGTYLIELRVNGNYKVTIGDRLQALARKNPEDLVRKKPRSNSSSSSKRIRARIVSPTKSYHLMKDDFLEDENPLGLNPFPEEGVHVMTDSLGKIHCIMRNNAENNETGTSIEDPDLHIENRNNKN